MENCGESVATATQVPMAGRSKGIKKARAAEGKVGKPAVKVGTNCGTMKENVRTFWQQATKTRTVLLNDILNRSQGPCQNGNILIMKMPTTFTIEGPLHPFKSFLKKEL